MTRRNAYYAAMQQTLSVRKPEASYVVIGAIARELCVEATYNRQPVRLAPHIVYTRHGEVYVDAVTLLREDKPPREEKVRSFKLTGLSGIRATDIPFRRSALYDPSLPRYEGETVFALAPQDTGQDL